MASTKNILPFYAIGNVVRGFGRGSKELGIPTANFPQELVDKLPEDVNNGIYYGLASVDSGAVYKMVMSIGWNPYYKNVKKSMETHIIHSFDEDFYGSVMKVLVIEYLRPEKNFSSVDELISAIKGDIQCAGDKLSSPSLESFWSHPYLKESLGLGVSLNSIITNIHQEAVTNGVAEKLGENS